MYESITDNINCIKVALPRNPLRSLNSYVVTGRERNLLIDTGFNLPESYSDLSEGIGELGLDMERTDIFLTHCHADHTGLAGRVASKNTRVYISEVDLPLASRMIGDTSASKERMRNRLFEAGYPPDEIEQSISLNPALVNNSFKMFDTVAVPDGFALDLGGFRLKAFYTPGHTPGHMCLYNEEEKILFTGDHVLFTITPNILSWPEMQDSLGSYLESLGLVAEMDVKLALPGHREAGDLRKRTAELLAHHEKRLDEVARILKARPAQTTYEIASQMTWRISENNWDDFPVSQKSFAIGEARSHLRYLECRGRVSVVKDGGVELFSPCSVTGDAGIELFSPGGENHA